jgi:hypothetical protein
VVRTLNSSTESLKVHETVREKAATGTLGCRTGDPDEVGRSAGGRPVGQLHWWREDPSRAGRESCSSHVCDY